MVLRCEFITAGWVRQVFVEMGMGDVKKVYKPEFEIPLLENTKRFYALECASWFNTDSCPEYLEKVA